MSAAHVDAQTDLMATVGLLEDDPDQTALLQHWLEGAGYACRTFPAATDFRRRLGAESVDALILDWNLPDDDGLNVLRWLRDAGHARLPVLFLTARDEESDIVSGLSEGADDYLVKPPRQGELLARVGALLRRVGLGDEQLPIDGVDPYLIEPSRRRVSLRGEDIPLTDREFELAQFLFRRRGRVVSRDTLLRQVWKIHNAVPTRTVDTHISRLRKKLELGGEHGWRLSAVYQHGYRLEQT